MTTTLCEKLGCLKQPSPRRPTLPKAATSHNWHKPGTTLQRPQNRKPRRTLERVLTEERSASQKPTPSLLRSATDPILPQLKREASDTSLSSIPLNRVAMQKRYSQREVDLHAASQAMEAKLKTKAKIDHELQTAIAALKKPNPRMAVKELVEDAERRVAGSRSRSNTFPCIGYISCTKCQQNLSTLYETLCLKVCRSLQLQARTDREIHSLPYRDFLRQTQRRQWRNWKMFHHRA